MSTSAATKKRAALHLRTSGTNGISQIRNCGESTFPRAMNATTAAAENCTSSSRPRSRRAKAIQIANSTATCNTLWIAPARLLPELPRAAESGFDELAAPFQTLTPREAKGLEFDRVVLVEPAAIVEEGERIEGLRALYVALTRATKTLVVVHARPLPPELQTAA